jgi:DNA-binding transcriptional MocR family regulator
MGMTMSATRRMLLLNWAVRTGAWIIEDDYDSEYRFGSRPIASLQGLDTDERVIYVGTFSKVMFPALRLGYAVVPKDLVPAFSAARDAADIFSSTLYQAVLTDFIREGHFARHIRRMRMLYMDRRRTLVNAIQIQMGEMLEVIGAEAGMHLVAPAAAWRQRCEGVEAGCPEGYLRNALVRLLLESTNKGRPDSWLRGRQRASDSRWDTQTQDLRTRPDRITPR